MTKGDAESVREADRKSGVDKNTIAKYLRLKWISWVTKIKTVKVRTLNVKDILRVKGEQNRGRPGKRKKS